MKFKRRTVATHAKSTDKRIQHRTEIEMPNGSGALVLYAKKDGKLKTAKVIALKSVSANACHSDLWQILKNVLLPHELSFSSSGPIWTDLKIFAAYRDQKNISK